MKKLVVAVFAVAFNLAIAEAASVAITSCEQDAETSCVTVTYTLSDGPAIVTFSVANGSDGALSDAYARAVSGDINKRVDSGAHTFRWVPAKMADADVAGGVKVVVKAWAESNPPCYMIVDAATGDVRYYASEETVPGGLTATCYKSSLLAFRRIEAKDKTFTMGSDETDLGHKDNETQHDVTLANDFYLGIYPVTQGQYKELADGSNPSYAKDSTISGDGTYHYPYCQWRPVECVSYAGLRGNYDWPNDGHTVDESKPIGVLRTRTGIDRFDLPTEAEWEFACRAGTKSALPNGKNWSNDNVKEIAWVAGNSLTGDQAAQIVGLKAPNNWGLYDMLGSVREFCLDWYTDDLGSSAVTAPTGPSSGTYRVVRGGGMASAVTGAYKAVRSAARENSNQSTLTMGFRLACAIPVATGDDPISASASIASFGARVVTATETTGHGTEEVPFEAFDRAFGEAAIEKFSSFPRVGILLFLR